MKRLVLLALIAAIALPIGFSRNTPAKAQDEQTLEVYITGLTEEPIKWFNEELLPAFEEAHPGVNVELLSGTWGDFDVTVAGWITTGEGPDIVYLGSEYAATYGDLLTDMDPYLADWEELDQFLPAALETATYDGHLRGLPLLLSARPMYYRTDLVADPAALPPLTFEDALTYVEANSSVEDGAMTQVGHLGIDNGLFDMQELVALIWSAGGELYYEDGTSAFDSEETAEALQFVYDRRRIIMPTEDTAGLPPFEGPAIASGVVTGGMFQMWGMPAIDDPLWENILAAPYPAGENGEPLIQIFIDWLSVPAYAENPELAAEFLKFLGSKENAIALNQVAGYTPVRTDAWEDLRANSPVWAQILDLTEEYGRAFSDIRASAELRPMVTEQVTLFLTDQQSLEDTQQNLKEEYDAILEANGYLD